MNERKNHISPKWIRISALLLVIFALPVIAADESGYALLLQSSPASGGKILPGNGVFKVTIGQDVPLIAVPQKGYRFLYWLGDVGQTDMVRTTVRVDSPKLIVAVFEREEFEDLQPAILEASGTSDGGTYNSNPLDQQGGMMGSRRIIEPRPAPTPPEEPKSDDFPVPNDPFPVPDENPVPEPVTILLFAAGSVAVMRMRRK
jgi:hypothetical protein